MNDPQPFVEVIEGEEAMLVRIDLGDVRPEDVTIDATERLLFVHAESFSRSFHLPAHIDGAAALAILSEGILSVRIPTRRSTSRDTFAA